MVESQKLGYGEGRDSLVVSQKLGLVREETVWWLVRSLDMVRE